jgi:hypothetical protein
MVWFTLVFSGFGILMWVAVGVLLYFRRRQLRKVDLMRRVETSSAAEVAGASPGTLVEVKGTLRCESPLRSEMAGQRCAYYLSEVLREYTETERDAQGDLRTVRRAETIASNERFAPFAVEDGSGGVGVRAQGAEIDALEVLNRFDEDTGGGGSVTLGGVTVNLGGGERTLGYRYRENILAVDRPVYVLGSVREDGQIGAPAEGSGERQFLITYRSEEHLEKKYKRDALVLGLVALGLFLFGAIFLAIGVAAATGVIS